MKYKTSLSIREIILCALFSALIGVGAFIKIPIPVVPFTLQFLFTNLAGLLLGKRLGGISVGVYIAVGLVGLPVFSSGGGLGYVFYPTFGYIIGFWLGAHVAGYIVDKMQERSKNSLFKTALIAGFANLIVVYALGMIYYYFIANYYTQLHIGVWTLILYCFILAVPGDILICFVSAALYKRLYPIMKREYAA